MSDFSLSVGVTGVEAAAQQLRTLGASTQSVVQQTQAAGVTATSAAAATSAFGGSAQQVAQRVQGMAGQVAALSSRLGGGAAGQAAGLVGSLAGVVAQSLAMGATMGPAGMVVGAISGLIPIVMQLVESNQQVTRSTQDMTETERVFASNLADSLDAINDMVTAEQHLAQTRSQRALIDQGLGSVDQQRAAADLAAHQVTTLQTQLATIERTETAERSRYSLLEAEGERQQRIASATQATAEARSLLRDAESESSRLSAIAVQTQEEERQIATDILEIDQEDARAAADRANHHERAAHAAHDTLVTTAQAHAAELTFVQDMIAARGIGDNSSLPGLGFGDDSNFDATIAHLARGTEAYQQYQQSIVSEANAAKQAQYELADAALTAQQSFEHGYVDSIDAVVSAYHRWTLAARAAGQETPAAMAAIGRGVVASGNQITQVIGTEMTGALKTSVSAWLSGAESFEQAAKQMVDGVMQSLVTESIVQGVVELARAATSAASSYGADPAVEMHLVAAGMWAAVGGAAGAAGAALGSFGHSPGAAAGGGVSTHDTSSASRESSSQQAGGNLTLNIYPGGFITKADISAGAIDILNHAARNGFRVDPRIIRQAP